MDNNNIIDIDEDIICYNCDGRGYINGDTCHICGGSGILKSENKKNDQILKKD